MGGGGGGVGWSFPQSLENTVKYLLRRATWENSFIAPTLGVLEPI
jgi:hypothetical protein